LFEFLVLNFLNGSILVEIFKDLFLTTKV